jgi:ankyrin repeat protein
MIFRIRTAVTAVLFLISLPLWPQKAPAPGELAQAAARGSLHDVEILLSRGADPDLADRDGVTALIYAAKNGDYALTERLLDAGADPDLADKGGNSPLIAAVLGSREDLVILLLDRKADPNLVTDMGSPLALALGRGDYEIAIRLVESGADGVDLANPEEGVVNPLKLPVLPVPLDARMWRDGASLRDFASSPDWDAALATGSDRWKLHRAARDNDWRALREELDGGASPDPQDVRGVTPLMTASFHGNESVAGLLLQRGADPQLRDSLGRNALCYAVLPGNRGMVRRLLSVMGNPAVSGSAAQNPVLQNPASVPPAAAALDSLTGSPVYYALLENRQAVFDDLVSAGISTSPVDAQGTTLLMIAAWRGNAYAVNRLLPLTDGRWGENPGPAAKDSAGRTALEWSLAAFRRDRETGRSLGNEDRGAINYPAVRLLADRLRDPESTVTIPAADTHPAVIASWSPGSGFGDSAADWRRAKPPIVPEIPGDGDLTLYRILRDEEPGTPTN